ncbi:hypothetical protein EJB05_10323, partial [Eragrostis curvula]
LAASSRCSRSPPTVLASAPSAARGTRPRDSTWAFCVVGEDDDCLHRIPGLPDNAICLGAAADGWLALDYTDDVFRRIPPWEKSFFNSTPVRPRPDVKHDHTYLLHNPFSGEAVSLPELDSIIGHVAETFEIRKVLMRSSSPDDLVAVITNNWNCNVILCCPGKGKCVVPGIRVFDVAFLGDRLYGITPEEELVAVDIDEDEDGSPTVTKCRRVIKKPLGADGWEDPWSWMYDDDVNDDDSSDEDDTDDDSSDEDDSDGDSSDDDDNDDGQLSASTEEEEGPDEDAPNQEENGDGQVPDGEDVVEDEENLHVTTMAAIEISTEWSNLRQDLIGRVIALLPFPADRARFRAVCRAWRSAARKHAISQLPWIVFPDCSFCTVGDDGVFFHHGTLPGVPKNATCLGAATEGWLALDCTDDVFRRTPYWDKFSDNTFLRPRPDVKHSHAYLLHNPFSGETVPLPELDSIVGHVAETFEIRKVLMRSSSPDDLVAVITNNWNYNVILCRPGKGKCVVDDLRVFDVAFHGDKLYGITPEEELVAFHLAEDEDGRPIVTKYRRVIKQQLADGAEDRWSWMYDDSSVDDSDYYDSDDDDDGEPLSAVSSEEEQESDEDDAPSQEDDSFNGDGMVPDGMEIVQDEEVPYEPKDYIVTTRRLVKSRGDGELLMVKHIRQTPPFTDRYTRKVEFFKADINEGTWVPTVDGAVGKGEALFLSRSFSKYNHAYGDIKEGHIYFMDIEQVFDTGSWISMPFSLPHRTKQENSDLLTWLFPPKLVV